MKFYRSFCCVFLWLMLCNGFVNAQSVFSGATGAIPDYPTDTCFTLSLANIFPAYIDTTFGLQKICLNIEHPSPQDLNIVLVAPDNSNVLISNQNGNGEEWEGVCFNMKAETSITTAEIFFNVEFLPEHNIGELNNGQLAAGLWQLCITDLVAGNAGTLKNWQLHFNFEAPNPASGTLKEVCTTNTTYGCACPDGGNNCFLLPDLIVDKTLTLQNFKEVTGAINFNTAISNIGFGPLEFYTSGNWYCGDTLLPNLARCENESWPKQLIKQRVYRKIPNQNTGFFDFDAGFMPYQTTQNLNNRAQITNWVENTIRIKGSDTNPLNWPIIVSAGKSAFCIENTLQCTESNMVCAYDEIIGSIKNLPNSRLGQNYVCNSDKTGIAVGYSHFDGQNVAGQKMQFSAATCNGTYFLVTEFDPDSIINELNEFNNVAAIEFQLNQQIDNCCTAEFSATHLKLNGSFISFEDLSTPIPNSWFWTFGDGNSANTQFPTNEYASPGEYTITLTTENELGCVNSISRTILVQDVEVSINDLLNDASIKITLLSNKAIQLNLSAAKKVSINLLNIEGKFIESLSINEFYNKGTHTKKIPTLAAGIYLLQINIEGNYAFEKLILF